MPGNASVAVQAGASEVVQNTRRCCWLLLGEGEACKILPGDGISYGVVNARYVLEGDCEISLHSG